MQKIYRHKGSASLLNEPPLQWKIDELGTKASEGASLEFTVKHIGSCSGTVKVNNYVSYEDKDLNIASFPSPEIEINCGDAVFPERCPTPVSIPLGGCEDAIEFDGGDINLESLGRILQLDMTIKNVCPNRRVALAVIITEVDRYGIEHNRGIKTMTIPAHTKKNCSDVTVRCIKFVLPEDLDVSGSSNMICDTRNFKARFIAHYIDNDFECCNNVY